MTYFFIYFISSLLCNLFVKKGFCTLFCFYVLETAKHIFLRFEKICGGRLGALRCAMGEDHFWRKTSVTPDAFLIKIWASPFAVRFGGQATALGRTGWILVYRPKEGAPSGSMQWRFLFWHRQKRRKRYFCKSNKTPPLVSARNHKKLLWFEEVGNQARIAIALAKSHASVRQNGEALFVSSSWHWARFNGFNVCHDLMALWSLYSATNCRKSGKYTVPLFRFFMDFLQIHILAFYGHVILP